MAIRHTFKNTRRWVIKIGSSLLTDGGKGLDGAAIKSWVAQMVHLRNRDVEVVLVSSGAVAAGMSRLGWQVRPDSIHQLQAAAAVGQMGLIQAYEQAFKKFGLHTAQVLVDHDDLSNRQRYLNARSTLRALLEHGVVPVVNENDTVVTDEIRFGDNDTLAALIANLVEAEILVILTDQAGMYESDPRVHPDTPIVDNVSAVDPRLESMAGGRGVLGQGGMITKVRAARLAARSGAHTLIVGGRMDNILTRIIDGEKLGSLLVSEQQPQAARKRWIAGQLQTRGALILDDGAVDVLRKKGRSLLPVGVKSVVGDFTRGDMVVCKDLQGGEIARGLINYNSDESRKIIGSASEHIEKYLGYRGDDELIHRDNLVLV